MPGQVLQDVFALEQGAAKITRGEGGYFISRLKSVTPADPAADTAGVDGMREELAGLLRDDLVTQLAGALRQEKGVTVNEAVLGQILNPAAQTAQ